jgi:hypothetical protein
VQLSHSATDIAFSADGSFAYIASDSAKSIRGYSTCSLPGTPATYLGTGTTSGTPLKVFSAASVAEEQPPLVLGGPNKDAHWIVESIVVLDPPNIDTLKAQYTQEPQPIGVNTLTCIPPVVYPPLVTTASSVNLGQGTFSPLYMRVVGDGSRAVVVANLVPAVLVVDLNQQTTTAFPLANNGLPLAASSSSDGSQVYVAACDVYTNNDPTQCTSGSVHIINTLSGGDIQQVPYSNSNTNNSMCTVATAAPCFPDMIAIKAQ